MSALAPNFQFANFSNELKAFIREHEFNPNDLNALNNFGANALNTALHAKKTKVIKELIHLGVDVHKQDGWVSESNLHMAIKLNDPEIVEMLCKRGVEIHSLGRNGHTPFNVVMNDPRNIIKKPQLLKILIQYGAQAKNAADLTEVSDQEIRDYYLKLKSLIQSEYHKARLLGKKFVVLLGEGHQLKQSLLIEALILHIAHELHIKNIILEINDAMLLEIKNKGEIEDSYADFMSFYPIFTLASTLGMNVFAGDPNHGGSIDVRNKSMSEYLKSRKDGNTAVSIIGSAHFEGLMKDYPVEDSVHILAINTYPLLDIYKNEQRAIAMSESLKNIKFLAEHKNIHQFYYSHGNPELWNDKEILEKITTIIQAENAIKCSDAQGSNNASSAATPTRTLLNQYVAAKPLENYPKTVMSSNVTQTDQYWQNKSDSEVIAWLQKYYSDPNKNEPNPTEINSLKLRLGLKSTDNIKRVNGLEIAIESEDKIKWFKITALLKSTIEAFRLKP